MRSLLVVSVFLIARCAMQAAEPASSAEVLTIEESDKLEAARRAIRRDPAVKAEYDKYVKSRKAYQEDRRKFPNDRDQNVALAWRKAEKTWQTIERKALTAHDASLTPLLDKKPRTRNEGETLADSDLPRNDAMRPIDDVPGLPRVLLVGDSISIGYTLPVRERLKGKANVHRIPINGGATEIGVERMKEWLGDGKWDVIHFNFGLHDAKYQSETELRSTHEQYAKNLQTIIDLMKPTGAKLIFATTTPVPKGGELAPGRKFDSIEERNAVARKVMAANGAAIDDLYSVALPVMEKVGRPNDVHFAPEGYQLLAEAVAASILKALASP